MKTGISARLMRLTVLSVWLGTFLILGDVAAVEPPRCAGTGISVPQWAEAEREQVCLAAEAAIRFLRDAGFAYENGHELTVRPVEKPPAHYFGREFGHFDVQRNEICMLPLAAATRATGERGVFDMPMNEALWSSYVSHEVAHAVAERHFAAGVRRFTASECIAGVTQLVTMQPALREAILARYPGLAPYRSTAEMSSLYYLMAPAQFAIKVYLYYIDLGDGGPALLQRLLDKGLDK
jgi:hypothetical protein